MSPLAAAIVEMITALVKLGIDAATGASASHADIVAQYDAIDTQFRAALGGLAGKLAADDAAIDAEIAASAPAAPVAAPDRAGQVSAVPIVSAGAGAKP